MNEKDIVGVYAKELKLAFSLIDGAKERFWFSFSIGSISGLAFSLVTLVLVMPLLMKKK